MQRSFAASATCLLQRERVGQRRELHRCFTSGVGLLASGHRHLQAGSFAGDVQSDRLQTCSFAGETVQAEDVESPSAWPGSRIKRMNRGQPEKCGRKNRTNRTNRNGLLLGASEVFNRL